MSNSNSDRVRGDLLQAWREALRWDVDMVASKTHLSTAQVRQLETGGDTLFYSAEIKQGAARKVARLLGGDAEAVIAPLEDPTAQVAPAILEDLRALAQHQNPSNTIFWRPGWHLAGLLVVVIGVALMVAVVWIFDQWQHSGSAPLRREPAVSAVPPPVHGSGAHHAQGARHPAAAVPLDAVMAADPPSPAVSSAASDAGAALAGRDVSPSKTRVPSVPERSAAALCQITPQGPVIVPARPSKAGDMVYVVAQKDGRVCVVDATGARTVLTLQKNEARSVYGPPPWQVHFEHPAQAQLYFQGVRMRWPNAQATSVALKEAAMIE